MDMGTTRLVEVVRLMAGTFELEPLLASIDGARHELQDDPEMREAIEALAEIAIKRQLLLDAAQEKERLAREMTRARELIAGLLPAHPELPGYELAGWMQPAHQTGGDLYDVVRLDDERHLLLVADAAGHGVDSTLIVTKFRAYVRALVEERPLAQVSERVNRLLFQDSVYVTAFLGLLDSQRHNVEYVSAGQHPVLHVHDGQPRALPVTGPPFGADRALVPAVAPPLDLAPGDLLVLASDGLIEWRNPEGEFYGDERLLEALQREQAAAAADLIQALCNDVRAFARGRPAADDLTMVVLRRCS